MNSAEFMASLANEAPGKGLSEPLAALWWDAKGDWTKSHALVDSLDDREGMAVHAYLHRKEGDEGNAGYWYRRSGTEHRRPTLEAEWRTLVESLCIRQ